MADDRTEQSQDTTWRDWLPFLLMMPLIISLFAGVLQNSIEFTPDHSAAMLNTAWLVTVAAGISAFALTLATKPTMRVRPIVGASLVGLMTGAGMGILTYRVVDRVWQTADFSGAETRTINAYFPISRAYITHGKSGYDHIQLSLFAADLHASPRDYHRLFHDADDIRPIGYCIHARLQRHGDAIRLFIPAIGSFPTGSISRCSSQSTSLNAIT